MGLLIQVTFDCARVHLDVNVGREQLDDTEQRPAEHGAIAPSPAVFCVRGAS